MYVEVSGQKPVRRNHRYTFTTSPFPVYGTQCRSGRYLLDLRRQGLQNVQVRRMGGNIRCGNGASQRFKKLRTDPDIYSGFAFGMGIDRVTYELIRINDMRLLFENDLRFLKQF